MYEVVSFDDQKKWNEKLESISKRDIFYTHFYCSLYEASGYGNPYLFSFKDLQGNIINYVFMKRRINTLPFLNEGYLNDEYYDIITVPYGYGGPLYDYADLSVIQQFRSEFNDYCQTERIISEFIRFHPLLYNHEFLEPFLDLEYDRETIFIDLLISEDDLVKRYHHSHKRNILKARKMQVEFKTMIKKEALENIDYLYGLYRETMDKVGASSSSYFSIHYFEQLLAGLNQHTLIGAVFFNDKIKAAAFCLYEDGILHYHLGFSNRDYLNFGINPFLFHQIALWGKQNDFRTFHLGGGHVGRDSLFQFKHRFNREGTRNFFIGKKIHNPKVYNSLIILWEEFYRVRSPQGFFPIYRSPQTTVLT